MSSAAETAMIIASVAEVAKLLIMAQNSKIRAGMTDEQFKQVANAINLAFEARKPEYLPER